MLSRYTVSSKMDLQTLSNLFATTYNPDPNVRKAAELQIRKIGNEEGMITALLQIIASDNTDLATRQACSVWVKNRVSATYTLDEAYVATRSDRGPIVQSDRIALKANILPLLSASPSRSINLQLASALKNMVAHDFPDRWPGLLDEIKRLLGSGNIREVHAGCVAALEAVRAFRFRQQSDVMPKVVSELFPTLVAIATNMLTTPPTQSQEIPTMLHLILKTYKTSIVINLSTHQQSAESLVPWGQLLFNVVNLAIPKEAVPEDEEEREQSEWWIAKKWAYATLGRLFHRFGNPSQLPTTMQTDYGAFAQHFVTMFAPEILNIYLRQVELYVSGQSWLSKKCQYHIFSFFTECVKPKSTWTLLKPHFETLVSTFAFPHLCFTPTKQALWENDPVDYIRVSVDEYESYATPVSAATTFLFSLAGNRTKTSFMPILGFINNILRSNSSPQQRFGALNMTAALGPWIMKHPEVATNMEQFIQQFVTPEFASPEPYLRGIACEVVGTVAKHGMEWMNEENLNSNFRAIARALDDPEFPVKVHAALSLTELIVSQDTVRNQVAPQVGKVIQDLLKMSDETDLDILNHSMEVMVEQFQEELLPVAAQLTSRLCESYLRLARESNNQETLDSNPNDLESIMADADDDKTYAAMGVAKTIWTIVTSVDSSPEILAQIQEIIIPIIVYTLEAKLLDLFDNVYDLIDSLTFKTRSVSPNMWPVFELTYKLFKNDAVDFLEEMLPSLDNFISYGAETIKQRTDYKQMLLDIYTTSITSDHLGENDRVNGCKLAESMLLNLRGHIDDFLQPIIATTFKGLEGAETSSLKLALLEVAINCVLYNPSAALTLMENTQPGCSRVFFDKWFAAINNEKQLPRVHDKKLSIITLTALMEMEPGMVPEPLREGWPGIVAGALKLFKALPKAVADRKALEEAMQEEEDDDDIEDEKILNMNGDDEDVWDEDSAYLEMLASEGARLRAKSEKLASGEDADDDSDEEEIEEELGYISPLDDVNPYTAFKQSLTVFQMRNPAGYQAATTALNVDEQTLLMEIMRIADQPTPLAAI
ncbi:nonsense-mediated mrna decay protein [Lentinula edodes]|uniref:Nonsense-mediated mrna decay protein n=2 Tax=Lentinula edodes TaxID=5353 RepID=A0A1Q3E615_LENED|nr:nonsense-mediated mrna decay protein [Lentinula edodes]